MRNDKPIIINQMNRKDMFICNYKCGKYTVKRFIFTDEPRDETISFVPDRFDMPTFELNKGVKNPLIEFEYPSVSIENVDLFVEYLEELRYWIRYFQENIFLKPVSE